MPLLQKCEKSDGNKKKMVKIWKKITMIAQKEIKVSNMDNDKT